MEVAEVLDGFLSDGVRVYSTGPTTMELTYNYLVDRYGFKL